MSLSKDEIDTLTISALKEMLADHGPDFRFPFDLLWQYLPADVEVPSLSRPAQARRLLKTGHLEPTGGQTRAATPSRASSSTREYRFGPVLVSPTTAPTNSIEASSSDRLRTMQTAMETTGYLISAGELANFYLAMTVSPLVILSGISGTGKSLLPRRFAQLTNSSFHPIPVQPQWSDNSDLFGYVPTLSPDKHVQGALTKSLLEAKLQPSRLVVALLDEINLAPVEHYFSNFLSVAETRVRVDGRITTDNLPIELPSAHENADDLYAEIRDMCLPSNLRVVGTANMNETTHMFSPKVLDRAFTIEFDDPVLTDFASTSPTSGTNLDTNTFDLLAAQVIQENNAISIQEAQEESQLLFEYIAQLLSEIQEILAPSGIKFGYRTRDAILLYLHFWRKHDLKDVLTGYAALDYCILQKILSKISGSGEALSDVLDKLITWLESRETPKDEDPFPEFSGKFERSINKSKRMAALLDLDGTTRFWGA